MLAVLLRAGCILCLHTYIEQSGCIAGPGPTNPGCSGRVVGVIGTIRKSNIAAARIGPGLNKQITRMCSRFLVHIKQSLNNNKVIKIDVPSQT